MTKEEFNSMIMKEKIIYLLEYKCIVPWGINLIGADLEDANLRDADLRGANLRGANLRGANLRGADLRGANLRDANLERANFEDADLRGANFEDADLRGANLRGANLRGANLKDANLDYASFPLWCGSLNIGSVDKRLFIQLLGHAVALGKATDDKEVKSFLKLKSLRKLLEQSHRWEEFKKVLYLDTDDV